MKKKQHSGFLKKNAGKRLRMESLRKLFHLMGVPLIVIYLVINHYFGSQVAMLFLTLVLIVILEAEYLRLEYKLQLPKPIDVLRKHEKRNITGSIFFVISVIICFGAFDFPIAIMALLMTVFGDMFSALFGISFGHHKIKGNKTVEGFFGGFFANTTIGALMLPTHPEIYLPMAITASVVEVMTGKLDDNLTVPIASGFVAQSIVFLFNTRLDSFPGPLINKIIELCKLQIFL